MNGERVLGELLTGVALLAVALLTLATVLAHCDGGGAGRWSSLPRARRSVLSRPPAVPRCFGDGATATKRTSSTRTRRSKPFESETAESKLIERGDFDRGVRLAAQPFKGTDQEALTVCSEIGNHKPRCGSEVRFIFPAASRQNPLRVLEMLGWIEAMTAIVAETRAVQVELRTAATGRKKKRP